MSVHEINPRRPDRLTALDIVALTDVEVRASLIQAAGHQDPAVAEAVAEVVRYILEHTRPGGAADVLGQHRIRLDKDPGRAAP